MKALLLTFVFFILATTPAFAAISINEFSSNSDPEWVELYNSGGETIDLTGWSLVDEVNHKEILSGQISSNGFFVYERAEGWLNNGNPGDIISLYNNATPSGALIDSISYGQSRTVGIPDSDKSAGRIPDGSGNWTNNLSWSKSAANIPPPSPTPSNTPGATNTPTSIPTSTLAPTATVVPTVRPTVRPTPSPTIVALIPTIGEEEFVTSQLLDFGESPPPTNTPAVLGESTTKANSIWPMIIIGAGVIGLIISLILLFLHSRKSASESGPINLS